ncbi:sigma-70 family RNA polymerase sigma factor [uncultured Bacteroides sp.]|uniref:RNA polymerase sigma factor n=1 Tax=uncultured Bacteroides sp. TaxID=162156 RepID=UPI0025FF8435|nr:sigma-70 family RNA polymerase sigma factor [uncultured Bacteroides sp.]
MNFNELDDITLWSLLIEGNLCALETIYKRHYALLLNYGLKFCQDIELTKDCIQDVFVKLHKSKELSQTVSPRAYLLKALRNTLYDHLLLSKETANLDEFAFHISESNDLFESLFLKNDEDLQLSKQLLKALSSLPSNQKTILYLRFVKELSHKEIAEIMNINVQSSMNLASRALIKLRGLMKNSNLLFMLLLRI